MTSNADNIVFIIVFLLNFLLFYFLPTINGRGTLFGFVVREDDESLTVQEILRKYRLVLLLMAAIFFAAIIVDGLYFPKSLVFIYILSILASGFWLHVNFLRSWRLRKVETFSRFAATLKPRKLADFTNFWWEIAILVLSLLPILLLLYFYPQFPEKIPVHWNAVGQADRFEAKSLVSVFFSPFLNLYLQAFFLLLKNDTVTARFRVPAENAERIMPLKESLHLANVNLLDWCRLMISVMFAVVAVMLLLVLPTTPISTAVTSLLAWLDVTLFLVGMAFYVYRMMFLNREIKQLTGQVTFQTAGEEAAWTDGIFYRNADDAAFFIEKPSGMGYTLNMANKRSYIYLAMIAGLILSVVLLPILL